MSLASPASVVECIQPAPLFQIASVMVTVTGVDMNRVVFRTCCNSLRLAAALLCRMERLWAQLTDSVLDSVRKETRGCDYLQGFPVQAATDVGVTSEMEAD